MKLCNALLVLALASVGHAQYPEGPCCMPDQFEGWLGESGFAVADGNTETKYTATRFAYDYPNRRVFLQVRQFEEYSVYPTLCCLFHTS